MLVMIRKNFKLVLLASLAATVSVGTAYYMQMQDAPTVDVYASNSESVTIEQLKESVLRDGTIPNDYLIEQISETWKTHHGTEAKARERIAWTTNFLDVESNNTLNGLANELTIREINFITLAEKPGMDLDEVAALGIAKQKLSGTYVVPEEPVRKYHEYILSHYEIPVTHDAIQSKLAETTGDLVPLADVIVDIRNSWAERGVVPLELDTQDTDYWSAIGHLFDCEQTEDDCSEEHDYLDNRRWEDPSPEHVDPPG